VNKTYDVEQFIVIFTSILYEALPFIILGALISGLLEELVPQSLVTRLLPRRRILAILLSGLLGLVFPMCECGIVPVMRRLLRKGVPLSCCICYMLAGPIINVVVLFSTYVAFNGMETASTAEGPGARQLGSLGMTVMRAGLGYIVAVITALVVDWQYRIHGVNLMAPSAVPDLQGDPKADETIGPRPSVLQRISNISETALHDFVDITVFLTLGALLSATARLFYSPEKLAIVADQYPMVAILALMGLAIVLCLCSEADAFVAASFRPLPPAAKLAFLVLGPMLDFKLYLMFTRVFRPRLMWTIIICVVIQVFVFANITHLILQNVPIEWFDRLANVERSINSIFITPTAQ
jgi:uncharacterized membrane protein YraQ (UPF0718 family)